MRYLPPDGSTDFPREVAEAALAHVVSDKTEAAYARGDLFDKRAGLMRSWADHLRRDRLNAYVVKLGSNLGRE